MPADIPSPPGILPAADPPAADRPSIALPSAGPRADALTVLAIGVTVVVALYVGQDLLVPLALGALLSFALAPLVARFQRWRLGRIGSVLLAVAIAMAVLVGVASVLGGQLIQLAEDLPQYETNIRAKIRDLKSGAAGGGLFERTAAVIEDIGQEISGQDKEEPPPTSPRAPISQRPADAPKEPVLVRVEPAPATPFEVLREVAGPVIAPAATAGLVLVFVIFMLLQRYDLRDRMISLAGTRDMRRATAALDEAGQRVSRYLLTHLVLNLLYGVPVGIGLWLIGVPNPALWGLLATVLRFIPFLGPVIAASFPVALSVAVDPGWTLPVLTIALFMGLELFSNNVLEPWLYGSSTGLSPFAVVLAAIFWTALWGPVGLLLATPLTVCLVVLGKHVPQLGFLEVLLGNQPALPAPARIYQRLLARAPDEAALIANDMARTEGEAEAVDQPTEPKGATWIYDTLLLPALRMAEQDRRTAKLSQESQAVILQGVEALVDHLIDGRDDEDQPVPPGAGRVLCISSRGHLDEAAGVLLADLLHDKGLEAEVLPCESVGVRTLPRLGREGVEALVVSYLDIGSGRHAARLVRRLKRHFGPQMPVVIGDWTPTIQADGELKEDTDAKAQETARPQVTGADAVARSLAEAVALVTHLGTDTGTRPETGTTVAAS
ncbi:AI-2E family transporter [Indioceanicola profundi]|uniref:AI-2E family transporter n=1 Tax=Indioceanicola profundi TaxID=2220096 RepID=UPI0013C4FEC7|nr:AI-2E family transporter [Indioceanicola profundi]